MANEVITAPYVPGSLIAGALRDVRHYLNESETNARYTDARLLDFLHRAWDDLVVDFWSNAEAPPVAYFTLTPVAGQTLYILPPNILEILRIGAFSGTDGSLVWESIPTGRYSVAGPQWILEDNRFIRWVPWPTQASASLVVEYVPGPGVYMQSWATLLTPATAALLSTTTGLFPVVNEFRKAWSLGSEDGRTNYCLGHYLRFLGSYEHTAANGSVYNLDSFSTNEHTMNTPAGFRTFAPQERQITAMSMSDRTLTVAPACEFSMNLGSTGDPNAATLFFEIVPTLHRQVFGCMAQKAAMYILQREGPKEQYAMLKDLHAGSKRSAQLVLATRQTRVGRAWDQQATPTTWRDWYGNRV